MKKVILVCNAGMSSSLMAKKTTEQLKKDGKDIIVDATTSSDSDRVLTGDEYDMVLVSPQIRMYFDAYKEKADKSGKAIAQVPFNAYAPTPAGIKNMENIILENLE